MILGYNAWGAEWESIGFMLVSTWLFQFLGTQYEVPGQTYSLFALVHRGLWIRFGSEGTKNLGLLGFKLLLVRLASVKGLGLTSSLLIRSVLSWINVSSLSCYLASTWMFNVSVSSDSCLFQIKSNFLLSCSSACSTNNLALVVSKRQFKRFSSDFTEAFDEAEKELVRLDELLELPGP